MKNRKIIIGRATDCDLVLADMSISRRHAELELLENNLLLLTDCHSSQGSFVIRGGHEEKVTQQIISKNDLLKFGNISIPVSEILTATQFYQHNPDVAQIGASAQANNGANNMKLDLNKNSPSTATQSLTELFLSFDGRVSRSTYWLKYMLPYFLIYVVLAVLDIGSGSFDYDTGYGTFSGLFTLAGIIPSLAMGVKRCHDRNRTGWFLLVGLIPVIGLWPLIELWFLKGTDGSNQYGADPLF